MLLTLLQLAAQVQDQVALEFRQRSQYVAA
jgi:hypothetical protein